jgi:hypothetical protein
VTNESKKNELPEDLRPIGYYIPDYSNKNIQKPNEESSSTSSVCTSAANNDQPNSAKMKIIATGIDMQHNIVFKCIFENENKHRILTNKDVREQFPEELLNFYEKELILK